VSLKIKIFNINVVFKETYAVKKDVNKRISLILNLFKATTLLNSINK